MKPVNDIDVSGADDCFDLFYGLSVSVTYLRHSVLMEGITCLWLSTHPWRPPAHSPLPPTHPPLLHSIHDITVAVKKLSQNLAVLAT